MREVAALATPVAAHAMPPAASVALWPETSAAARASGFEWRFALSLADASGALDALVFGEDAYRLLCSAGVGVPCDLRANQAVGAALDDVVGRLFLPSAYMDLCVRAYRTAGGGAADAAVGGGGAIRFRVCGTMLKAL